LRCDQALDPGGSAGLPGRWKAAANGPDDALDQPRRDGAGVAKRTGKFGKIVMFCND
jgi:hypothetical protein